MLLRKGLGALRHGWGLPCSWAPALLPRLLTRAQASGKHQSGSKPNKGGSHGGSKPQSAPPKASNNSKAAAPAAKQPAVTALPKRSKDLRLPVVIPTRGVPVGFAGLRR